MNAWEKSSTSLAAAFVLWKRARVSARTREINMRAEKCFSSEHWLKLCHRAWSGSGHLTLGFLGAGRLGACTHRIPFCRLFLNPKSQLIELCESRSSRWALKCCRSRCIACIAKSMVHTLSVARSKSAVVMRRKWCIASVLCVRNSGTKTHKNAYYFCCCCCFFRIE